MITNLAWFASSPAIVLAGRSPVAAKAQIVPVSGATVQAISPGRALEIEGMWKLEVDWMQRRGRRGAENTAFVVVIRS